MKFAFVLYLLKQLLLNFFIIYFLFHYSEVLNINAKYKLF